MKANPARMTGIGSEEAAPAAGDGAGDIATSCAETDEDRAAMKKATRKTLTAVEVVGPTCAIRMIKLQQKVNFL